MVLRKFPVYSFLSRRHGVKGKKKKRIRFLLFLCAGHSHSVCGASSFSPGNGYILGFSIINLASRHCVSPASDRSPHLNVGSVWTALCVRYNYYLEERSIWIVPWTESRSHGEIRPSVSLWEDPRFPRSPITVSSHRKFANFIFHLWNISLTLTEQKWNV